MIYAAMIACDGVYGRLRVSGEPEDVCAIVVDSIEHVTRPSWIARIAHSGRWLGVDRWTRSDVTDRGEIVEIAGCFFRRAIVDVVRDGYPAAHWSAGRDAKGRGAAKAEHDGRVIGVVMGLTSDVRQ